MISSFEKNINVGRALKKEYSPSYKQISSNIKPKAPQNRQANENDLQFRRKAPFNIQPRKPMQEKHADAQMAVESQRKYIHPIPNHDKGREEKKEDNSLIMTFGLNSKEESAGHVRLPKIGDRKTRINSNEMYQRRGKLRN